MISNSDFFKISDERLIKLDELIEAKRQMLQDKQKKIQNISGLNQFLEGVQKDYLTYNNVITKQKNDQIQALELIHKYIDDLKTTEQNSSQTLADAQNEQNKIMNEISLIKQNLKSIIN